MQICNVYYLNFNIFKKYSRYNYNNIYIYLYIVENVQKIILFFIFELVSILCVIAIIFKFHNLYNTKNDLKN